MLLVVLIISVAYLTLLYVLLAKAPKKNPYAGRIVSVFSRVLVSAVAVGLTLVVYREGLAQGMIEIWLR